MSQTSASQSWITCKAAILRQFGTPFVVETIEVAPPQNREVRVKIVACGICHSDVTVADNGWTEARLPFVGGHEGAGIVESVGAEVTSVQPGDKVFCMAIPQCKKCKYCQQRKSNCCLDQWGENPFVPFTRSVGYDGQSRFRGSDGQPLYHFLGSSSFSEYVVIPESSCVKVNAVAPLDKVCIIACAFSTGYGASHNLVDIRPNEDKVAVWGLGGVGLCTVMGCKDRAAKIIIGIDVNSEKEAIGRQLGCTHFINPKKNDVDECIRNLAEDGLDFAFCCGGGTDTIEAAIRAIGIQGTAVTVTIPKDEEIARLPAVSFSVRRNIKAALLGGYHARDDLPKLVDNYLAGKYPDFDRIISHRVSLEQINEGMQLVRNGQTIKTVIMMSD